MKACFVALLMVGVVLASTRLCHGGGKDQAKQDGTWVAIAMEQDGAKVPSEAVKKLAIKLILMGDKYKVTIGDKVADQGTSKADLTKKPITVDIDASEGPNKGKTIRAILEIEGNTMKVCYNLKGAERPTEFSTKKDSGHVIITYEREKK